MQARKRQFYLISCCIRKHSRISQTMYARYERGANELPIHHLIKLCELYQVSSDYFLGLRDTP